MDEINTAVDFILYTPEYGQVTKACLRNIGEEHFKAYKVSIPDWAKIVIEKAGLIAVDWDRSNADRMLN